MNLNMGGNGEHATPEKSVCNEHVVHVDKCEVETTVHALLSFQR